jgi:hypothetical protein
MSLIRLQPMQRGFEREPHTCVSGHKIPPIYRRHEVQNETTQQTLLRANEGDAYPTGVGKNSFGLPGQPIKTAINYPGPNPEGQGLHLHPRVFSHPPLHITTVQAIVISNAGDNYYNYRVRFLCLMIHCTSDDAIYRIIEMSFTMSILYRIVKNSAIIRGPSAYWRQYCNVCAIILAKFNTLHQKKCVWIFV